MAFELPGARRRFEMQDPRYRRSIRCPVAILRMPFDAEGRIAPAAGRRARPVMVDDALRALGFNRNSPCPSHRIAAMSAYPGS